MAQKNSHLIFHIFPQCCFLIWHCCHVASWIVVKVGVVWLIWAICRLSKISCPIVHLITKLLRIGRITVWHLLMALSCKEFNSTFRSKNLEQKKRKLFLSFLVSRTAIDCTSREPLLQCVFLVNFYALKDTTVAEIRPTYMLGYR